ncbi:MAG: phage repressor protein [Candidatus Accumulibacter sp.]|nr:phage repressor protein [Accumulibacter sp.]
MDKKIEILRKLVESSGGVNAFARNHSVPGADRPIDPTYVSQILNGHRPFRDKSRLNMARRAGLPDDYFERIPSSESPGKNVSASGSHHVTLVPIPVVGTAQLGEGGYWAELETPVGFGDGFIDFPTRDRNAYAVLCRGDSIKPRIKDGEFVIVEPSHEPLPGDEVLVKSTNGRVMVKEFLFERDGKLHLLSVNEEHGRTTIPLPELEYRHYVVAIVKRALWRGE